MRSTSETARTILVTRQKCQPDELPPYINFAHRHLEKAPPSALSMDPVITCTLPVDLIRKVIEGSGGDKGAPPEILSALDQIESAELIYERRSR